MRCVRVLSLVACLTAGGAFSAWGLSAVAEVNESSWYKGSKATRFGGAELTRYYAPLPVFFEGWKSEPRSEIVDYVWDFGDGSPLFRGFNAAHVYEEPGQYTATLTVTDEAGRTASASVSIEALARDGKTYYVDSEIGNDSNPGTDPEKPWRTATKAFLGIHHTWYGPGDSVLFKRGQTFDLEAGKVNPGGWRTGYGYRLGAYGEGEKPLIRHVGTNTQPLVKFPNPGAVHITFMDLQFDGTSPEGAVSDIFNITNDSTNLLFLRCDLRNGYQSITLNGKGPNYTVTNSFIVGCTFYNSKNLHLFGKAHRYALLDNHIDYADNHLAYLSYLDKAIISGNVFTRPPHGRTALRVSGSEGYTYKTNNVHVVNNIFRGWVDPLTGGTHTGGGTRYTAVLVEFGPNTTTDQGMEYAIFEDNRVEDGETLIKFGNWEHVIVRRNIFRTASGYGGAARLHLGHPFERRPLKDIRIVDNDIISNEKRPGKSGVFSLFRYGGPIYNGTNRHQEIYFENNRVVMDGGATRLIYLTNQPGQLEELHSNRNVVFATSASEIFQIGGTWNTAGDLLDLAGWRELSGNDRNTLWLTSSEVPLPGLASAPDVATELPIPVSYVGASSDTGQDLKSVRLWVRRGEGPWVDTGLTSAGTEGVFYYDGATGSGVYHFSLQAEDSAGTLSPPPAGYGHATTRFSATTPIDEMSPLPAKISVAAVAASSPLTVTYEDADDEVGGSGLKAVYLWVRKDGGDWKDSGLSRTTPSGTFSFPASGDGVYEFATRVEDRAGNLSPVPAGAGAASARLDTVPPKAGALNAPSLTRTAPIEISFNGASDVGSGLETVELWVRKEAGPWAASGQSSAAGSGTFRYEPAESGHYAFALVARDRAGWASGAPSGDGLTTTLYDVTPPTVGTVSTPDFTGGHTIVVNYSGAQDAHSGLRAVHLWARKGESGSWTRTGLSSTAPTGKFSYIHIPDNDVYYFATQAEDLAGNLSAPPSGDGAAQTRYVRTLTAGIASAPAYASEAPIVVEYDGASDSADGLKFVRLWYKKGEDGTWIDTGMTAAAASGSFEFHDVAADDRYYFAVQAEDMDGNQTPAPVGNGHTVTVFDSTAPDPGRLESIHATNKQPITVKYAGVTDTLSGIRSVALWLKEGRDGAWVDTGLRATDAPDGVFQVENLARDGRYFFFLQAEDRAGVKSAEPTDDTVFVK